MPGRDQVLELAERFGENLRRIRKREDLSQERLARLASLHRTEIPLLEKGGRACRIDTLVKLAGAMGVPPEELLEGIGWVPGPDTIGTFSIGRRTDVERVVGGDGEPDGGQSDSSAGLPP